MKYHLGTCWLLLLLVESSRALNGVWSWECHNRYCQKVAITADNEASAESLATCRLFCSEVAALWPKPTGEVKVGGALAKVNINSLNVACSNSERASYAIGAGASRRFRKQVEDAVPRQRRAADGGKTLEVTCDIADNDIKDLTLETEEGYSLSVAETPDGRLNATITANNIFGAINGLTTLKQLVVYDDLRDEVVMPNTVSITDKPVYPYRGLILDTSRNYISVETIKRTLTAMGASKLNSFHWHITDSHSFPFTAESLPDLQKYGAYSPSKVYTPQDVAEIVQHGLECGVRVIPEFDAPAHVGEGWQNTDFVVCFNKKPWQNYCVEPPCGQFDPTKEKLYDAIEALYDDMLKQFNPPMFHMGGDEVHFGCWNSTPSIVEWMKTEQGWGSSEEDFVKLWDIFQNESLTRLYKKAGKQIPVVMWTSTLTHKEYLHYLPKDQYIIQIWTLGNDPQVTNLLENGYQVILSNYDALYLDCGFAGWVTGGNNWCSPYIGWQKIYDNKPSTIAGDKKNLVLGAEAALWTEQADSSTVDSRLWPRAAALAEALWSEPASGWREAEPRILVQRERLIDLGVKADALQPEWCRQYEESCPLNGHHNDDWNVTPEVPADSPPSAAIGTDSTVTAVLILSFVVATL